MRALAILMALCLLVVPTLYLAGTHKEIEQEEPPEPLEITIQDRDGHGIRTGSGYLSIWRRDLYPE